MKPERILDGNDITTEDIFHNKISQLLEFPKFYGRNLDALWDLMSGHIDTNMVLVWKNHEVAKKSFPDTFIEIIETFNEVKELWEDFEYRLE
jgi:ribonuclease inhibitor